MILLDISGWLLQLDRELFVWIHAKAANPGMDWLFKALRDALTWIPLYLFVLVWIIRKQKRYAWQFVLFTLIGFAITDYTSASLLKPLFGRLRPCFDPSLDAVIRTVVTCGGKYGMPSTHASNHFGMASFWFFAIRMMGGARWYWLWIWAFLIGYAQVYVGKHFPGDILVGAVLGMTTGYLLSLAFAKLAVKQRSPQV